MNEDVADVISKEITQLDNIDESVNRTIQDMGSIWKSCQDKMDKDNICFLCKKKFKDDKKFTIVKVPDNKVEKGLFVMAAVCNECTTDNNEVKN